MRRDNKEKIREALTTNNCNNDQEELQQPPSPVPTMKKKVSFEEMEVGGRSGKRDVSPSPLTRQQDHQLSLYKRHRCKWLAVGAGGFITFGLALYAMLLYLDVDYKIQKCSSGWECVTIQKLSIVDPNDWSGTLNIAVVADVKLPGLFALQVSDLTINLYDHADKEFARGDPVRTHRGDHLATVDTESSKWSTAVNLQGGEITSLTLALVGDSAVEITDTTAAASLLSTFVEKGHISTNAALDAMFTVYFCGIPLSRQLGWSFQLSAPIQKSTENGRRLSSPLPSSPSTAQKSVKDLRNWSKDWQFAQDPAGGGVILTAPGVGIPIFVKVASMGFDIWHEEESNLLHTRKARRALLGASGRTVEQAAKDTFMSVTISDIDFLQENALIPGKSAMRVLTKLLPGGLDAADIAEKAAATLWTIAGDVLHDRPLDLFVGVRKEAAGLSNANQERTKNSATTVSKNNMKLHRHHAGTVQLILNAMEPVHLSIPSAVVTAIVDTGAHAAVDAFNNHKINGNKKQRGQEAVPADKVSGQAGAAAVGVAEPTTAARVAVNPRYTYEQVTNDVAVDISSGYLQIEVPNPFQLLGVDSGVGPTVTLVASTCNDDVVEESTVAKNGTTTSTGGGSAQLVWENFFTNSTWQIRWSTKYEPKQLTNFLTKGFKMQMHVSDGAEKDGGSSDGGGKVVTDLQKPIGTSFTGSNDAKEKLSVCSFDEMTEVTLVAFKLMNMLQDLIGITAYDVLHTGLKLLSIDPPKIDVELTYLNEASRLANGVGASAALQRDMANVHMTMNVDGVLDGFKQHRVLDQTIVSFRPCPQDAVMQRARPPRAGPPPQSAGQFAPIATGTTNDDDVFMTASLGGWAYNNTIDIDVKADLLHEGVLLNLKHGIQLGFSTVASVIDTTTKGGQQQQQSLPPLTNNKGESNGNGTDNNSSVQSTATAPTRVTTSLALCASPLASTVVAARDAAAVRQQPPEVLPSSFTTVVATATNNFFSPTSSWSMTLPPVIATNPPVQVTTTSSTTSYYTTPYTTSTTSGSSTTSTIKIPTPPLPPLVNPSRIPPAMSSPSSVSSLLESIVHAVLDVIGYVY